MKKEVTLMNEFKDMLKYFRTQAGLSQAQLAEKVGVKPSTISMYEIGQREPDFETEEALADFFNVDLNTLRGKDTEMALSLAQRTVLDLFDQLPEGKQKLVIDILKGMAE